MAPRGVTSIRPKPAPVKAGSKPTVGFDVAVPAGVNLNTDISGGGWSAGAEASVYLNYNDLRYGAGLGYLHSKTHGKGDTAPEQNNDRITANFSKTVLKSQWPNGTAITVKDTNGIGVVIQRSGGGGRNGNDAIMYTEKAAGVEFANGAVGANIGLQQGAILYKSNGDQFASRRFIAVMARVNGGWFPRSGAVRKEKPINEWDIGYEFGVRRGMGWAQQLATSFTIDSEFAEGQGKINRWRGSGSGGGSDPLGFYTQQLPTVSYFMGGVEGDDAEFYYKSSRSGAKLGWTKWVSLGENLAGVGLAVFGAARGKGFDGTTAMGVRKGFAALRSGLTETKWDPRIGVGIGWGLGFVGNIVSGHFGASGLRDGFGQGAIASVSANPTGSKVFDSMSWELAPYTLFFMGGQQYRRGAFAMLYGMGKYMQGRVEYAGPIVAPDNAGRAIGNTIGNADVNFSDHNAPTTVKAGIDAVYPVDIKMGAARAKVKTSAGVHQLQMFDGRGVTVGAGAQAALSFLFMINPNWGLGPVVKYSVDGAIDRPFMHEFSTFVGVLHQE